MPNKSRYRIINFIGERILQPREMNLLQSIDQGFDATGAQASNQLSAIYRPGAFLDMVITVSGSTVSFAPGDSYGMKVFIRDRWETVLSGEANPVTLSGTPATVFVNWVINRVTLSQDSDLQDLTTGEPTAEMGELVISFSATDNSGAALTSGQLAKNTTPIGLATFNLVGGVYTLQPVDNVWPFATPTTTSSGLAKLSTNTSGGIAVANDDARMSNSRPSAVDGVTDVSVRTPVPPGGSNADGTPIYNLTSDVGGINAAKIILTATTQRLSDAWGWLTAQFSALLGNFNAHYTSQLGLSNTHPIPTPSQVGAAPLSHVGQPLGLSTSHPPQVNADRGGFLVARNIGSTVIPGDGAFVVAEGSTIIASLQHDGDIYSKASSAFTSTAGAGATGPMSYMSYIASALVAHINQTSHGNPHGLTLSDLGGASTSYVDTQDASVLTASKFYTDSVVNHAASFGDSGYYILPGNVPLIIQWIRGNIDPSGGSEPSQTHGWPIEFGNAIFTVQVSLYITGGATNGEDMWYQVAAFDRYNVTVQRQGAGTGDVFYGSIPLIFAIGY